MNKDINILCATDKNFVPYCGIMLTSLFENNKDISISVYLLIDATVAEDDKRLFAKLAEKYCQSINLVFVDGSRFAKYPVYNKQWTNSIYYRLLAAEILPDSIDRIIYLDCDIIVNGSLVEYWEQNVEDYALGVVEDSSCCKDELYERLSLRDDRMYFNSGSMLINLKYWREHNIKEKFLNYIAKNFEKLWFNDQDTLNGVLFDQKLMLPVKYNYQIVYLNKDILNSLNEELRCEILATDDPLVIHYSASLKPWMVLYYNMPYLKQWKYYKSISFWEKTPNRLPRTKVLGWLVKRYILWPSRLLEKNDYIVR